MNHSAMLIIIIEFAGSNATRPNHFVGAVPLLVADVMGIVPQNRKSAQADSSSFQQSCQTHHLWDVPGHQLVL